MGRSGQRWGRKAWREVRPLPDGVCRVHVCASGHVRWRAARSEQICTVPPGDSCIKPSDWTQFERACHLGNLFRTVFPGPHSGPWVRTEGRGTAHPENSALDGRTSGEVPKCSFGTSPGYLTISFMLHSFHLFQRAETGVRS